MELVSYEDRTDLSPYSFNKNTLARRVQTAGFTTIMIKKDVAIYCGIAPVTHFIVFSYVLPFLLPSNFFNGDRYRTRGNDSSLDE